MRQQFYKTLTKLIVVFVIIFPGTVTAVSGQIPVANFTAAPLTGCSPLIVTFQNLSTGNPTSWSWDFGNGNTSTIQNPTATYFTPGTYNVVLTVSNASGSNTLTRSQYITVYETPSTGFSANNTSGCFPLKVQFTDLSTAGAGNTNISWQWDFGDGVTSTQQNPLHIYTSAGLFSVTLKVTNDKGCIKTLNRPNYITVTPGVKAGFTNTQSTVCRPPADISFTNTSTGPGTLSYLWDFGDAGSSILINPVHTYGSTGSFMVTLIATSSAGCEDTVRSAVPIIIGGFNTAFTGPDSVCINEIAAFTNISSPAPVSANWTFGDGGSVTGVNASHSYSTPGTYTVWLFNTYSSCRDSTLRNIVVNPRPVADFTAPVTSKCQPSLTVNFQDLSTSAVSWQWNFGDGNTSILQNPVHTYNNYGNYTVTLIVINPLGCTDTIIKPNFIRIQRAVINIPGLPAQGCIPFTISLAPAIVSVDVVTSYQWDFGDGGTSTLPNPTYTYIAQGTYTIRLIITTSSGCTDTLTVPAAVRVGSKPIANFSASPIPVCAHQPVQFTDLSVPADQWQWSFGDGSSSTLQNPSHNYNDTGFFSVTLIATNNGCRDTIVKNNYIYVFPPIAGFTSAVTNCSNRLQFSFTDLSIVNPSLAPLTWSWNFGDGNTSTAQNPVHTFPAFGTYNVTLIVRNGSCADTITNIVQSIDQSPDFNASATTVCRGTTITFTSFNFNPLQTFSLLWDFGDGTQVSNNASAPSATHMYLNSGTYTVMLVTTDINGCRDTITKNNYIRVNGPLASFTANNLAGCTGLTTIFNDLSTSDGMNAILNWQWNFGDGTIQNFSGPAYQHTYNIPGTFSVKLKVTDASGCSDSITVNNLVTATDPVPNFISADTLVCPGTTVNFTNTSVATGFSSLWDFGDGATSTVTSPSHVYAATGFYNIKLRIQDIYGCPDSITKNLYIHVDRPIASFTVNDSISSCTPLQVQFTNTSTFYSSVLWNFGPGQGNSTLNNPVHYFSPGIYLVKLVITSPGGCLDSVFKTITVYDTSGSRVSYLPINGCKPLSISLNAFTSGPMASYYWDFGDGYTQSTSAPNANHTYASFGFFLPKVIMLDPSGCQIPLQDIDTVLVIGANAKFGFDINFFCDNGLVNFIDSTTFNDPILTYNWLFGDGGTSTQQNPSHIYTTPGNYNVSLIVQTQNGCRDTVTKANAIKIVQSPLIDIGGDSLVCVNSSILHTGIFLIPDTSVVTWSWNFPNGNSSSQQNPLPQTYNTAGNFTVTSIATNSSGCKDTTTQNIYVNPLPVVTMPGQMTVQNGFPVTIPATYSPNTISWMWSPVQGLSCPTCPAPDAGPKFNTIYQVYFTDDNGCSNRGSVEVIVICKNANLFVPNTFSPNGDGSNDVFYPRGKGLERVKLMRIFNRWGEAVFEKRDFPVNDVLSGWDGTFKGKKPQADVYIYQVEVFCDNGDIIRLNGNIALIL